MGKVRNKKITFVFALLLLKIILTLVCSALVFVVIFIGKITICTNFKIS